MPAAGENLHSGPLQEVVLKLNLRSGFEGRLSV